MMSYIKGKFTFDSADFTGPPSKDSKIKSQSLVLKAYRQQTNNYIMIRFVC